MLDSSALHIFTDGSSLPSPRRGGTGIRFVFPEYLNKEELSFCPEGYIGATSNKMELKACIIALEEVSKLDDLQQISRIVIHTDSQYIVNNFYAAKYIWPQSKWKTKMGAPVLNTDLWKDLIRMAQKVRKRVDIEWIKGHSKNIYNKAADKLAKSSAKTATKKLPGFVDVRRKLSSKSVERGSVKMLGQKISIRIITSEYLSSPHKIWRYKYEVISKRSKFYENLDFIYYTEVLRVGHSYSVSLNKNNANPQISKVICEIEG